MTPTDLYDAISAVCPIDSVSIGDQGDKGTWIIRFSDTATAPQKTAAAAVVANYVPKSPLDQLYDDAIKTQAVLKAVILALNDGSLPVGTNKTGPQLKAIIKAKM